MSKLDAANRRLGRAEAELAKLEDAFDAAMVERMALEARRLGVDRLLADGAADADAQFDGLDKDERKLAGRLRGLVLKRVEVREAVNVAREEQRALQAVENDAEAVRLRAAIAEVEATIAPMRARLMALRSGYVSAQDQTPRERNADAQALDGLRAQAAALLGG